MPYRRTIFATNEIYHVFNRGVAQAPIFLFPKEYVRFLNLIDFYRYANPPFSFSHYNRLPDEEKEKFMKSLRKSSPLVEIYVYCLMPNHFHLLLKQLMENGITLMLRNLQNSYAKYFNLKHKRQGSLFQSMFKAVRMETDEQFLHVSRYIHLNPSTSYLVKIKDLALYPWSSLGEYVVMNKSLFSFMNSQFILDLAGGREKYQEFVFDQAEYQRKLGEIKHLVLENT